MMIMPFPQEAHFITIPEGGTWLSSSSRSALLQFPQVVVNISFDTVSPYDEAGEAGGLRFFRVGIHVRAWIALAARTWQALYRPPRA